jgi:hypothetical protein
MPFSKLFDHTIYRRPDGSNSTVGITFKPTPSLTRAELHDLIADLLLVAHDMADKSAEVRQ